MNSHRTQEGKNKKNDEKNELLKVKDMTKNGEKKTTSQLEQHRPQEAKRAVYWARGCLIIGINPHKKRKELYIRLFAVG